MLLFFNEPFPDESLSSLLFRTANANLMDNLNWIIYNFMDFSKLNLLANEINWVTEIKLEKMAEFLSIPYQKAKELTFRSTLINNNLEVMCIEKNPWFLYSRIKCCPLCLQENLYHKKSWSSTHSLICLKHKVLLIDRCPDCKKFFDITMIINNKCKNCRIPITSFTPKRICASSPLISYQRNIDYAINGLHIEYDHEWIKDSCCFFKALEFIGNWAVRVLNKEELNSKECRIEYDGMAVERNRLKNSKSVEQAICIYSFAYNVLENWPANFYSFLKSAEQYNKIEYKNFIHSVIPLLHSSNLSFISKELNRYIASEKSKLDKNKTFIRTDQIKLMNDRFNASVSHSNLLKTYKCLYFGQNITFVCMEEMDSFFKEFVSNYTKQELKAKWGTSSKATLSILKNNTLHKVFTFRNGSSITWVIPKESVTSFEDKLISISHSFSEPNLILNRAIEWCGPQNTYILIEGILNGKIQFNFNSTKFGRSIVCKRDVYEYVTETLLKIGEKEGFISIRNLVFILGVKKSDIFYWLQTERFGTNIENNTEDIPIKNVNNFLQQYLTTLQLSIKQRISIKQVIKRYALGKISSVSGPQLRDGQRLLFEQHNFY